MSAKVCDACKRRTFASTDFIAMFVGRDRLRAVMQESLCKGCFWKLPESRQWLTDHGLPDDRMPY